MTSTYKEPSQTGQGENGLMPIDIRRQLMLFTPTLGVPVASLVTNALFPAPPRTPRSATKSESHQRRESRGTRFVLSRTEDAMDSVLPCAAEELFRPMMQSKFANPAKLNFRYRLQ